MGYNPCLECHRLYGRTYSASCHGLCDYAQCMKERYEWHTVAQYAAEAFRISTDNLKIILGKEETTDGK